MKRTENIEKELTEISTLMAGFSQAVPFQVPENYFETLPGKILEHIRLSEVGSTISASEEIEVLSPLLAGLKDKTSLSIPDDYFPQFQQKIFEHIETPSEPAKVISIGSRTGRSWTRYAAAAIVAGFLGIAALFFWNNRQPASNNSFAQVKTSETGSELPQIPEETLAGYLNGLPDNTYNQAIDSADSEFYDLALLKIDDARLGNMLENVPDDELAGYEGDL